MSKKVEFFYDYVSLYSYLANSQLGHSGILGAAEIVYRPMFLGGVMEATGNRPPASVKAKGRYLMQDVERWVRRYSMTLNMNPVFPQNTMNALRIAVVSLHRGEFENVHQALFDAMWIEQQDLSKNETLSAIVGRAGLSVSDYLEGIRSSEIKNELKANSEEAVKRGAFGAPTFYVDDQMFFGNDRFDFIAEAIAD